MDTVVSRQLKVYLSQVLVNCPVKVCQKLNKTASHDDISGVIDAEIFSGAIVILGSTEGKKIRYTAKIHRFRYMFFFT